MGPAFERLTVSEVSRHFGRRKALANVSFTCEPGDIVGLLGPNGAGKSTLLNILATLLSPSKGTISYGDRTAASGGAETRAAIGMLGHDLFLYPELTARENLAFFAQLYGLPDVTAAVNHALEQSGLSARADDFVSGFSRGMRQRVALERALLHDPRVILLDEPFTGLDQASAAALVARLRNRQQAGCMIVLATHDLEIAETLLTKVLFLIGGKSVADAGAGRPLRERYQAAVAASPA